MISTRYGIVLEAGVHGPQPNVGQNHAGCQISNMHAPSPPTPGVHCPEPAAAFVDTGQRQVEGPSKEWRNKWFSEVEIRGEGPGEFLTTTVYPSAEIAEQKASEILSNASPVMVALYGFRYVGPVPAGDA
jgi:hypothetical protein